MPKYADSSPLGQPRKLDEEARSQETEAVKSYSRFGTFASLVPPVGLNDKVLNQENEAINSYGGLCTFSSLGP